MRKLVRALLWFALLSPLASQAQTGAQFKQWAEETLAQIERDFRVPGSRLYYEDTSRRAFGFAWPVGVQLHALIAAGKIAEALAMADEIHSRYWCFHNNRWAYNAVAGSCGDRYYDDNAWIAKALMELYKASGNANALNRAKEIVAFSMSGENRGTAPGGGIRFHEGDASGQCLCATAPTMVASLMLYQATGTQRYLDDGRRLYLWVKANRFETGPGYRGYENAVITQAAILLYRITGDASYLADARYLGLAMESTYIDWESRALKETGQWGGHDMTNAYVDLFELDGDVNWLNIAAGYLRFLHDRCKDGAGRYPEFWNTPGVAGKPSLLYQAAAARAFARMATTPGGQPKPADPVAVFKDCNYEGWNGTGLGIGRYSLADLKSRGLKDKDISSVRVQPGYRVIFYEADAFQGASLIKEADQSCLVQEGWNDRVRSLVIEAVRPTVIVYKDCNFSGRAVNLPAGDYNLEQLKALGINNDEISSLRVGAGSHAVAYKDDSFMGGDITIEADRPCLDGTWNDLISSLKIR